MRFWAQSGGWAGPGSGHGSEGAAGRRRRGRGRSALRWRRGPHVVRAEAGAGRRWRHGGGGQRGREERQNRGGRGGGWWMPTPGRSPALGEGSGPPAGRGPAPLRPAGGAGREGSRSQTQRVSLGPAGLSVPTALPSPELCGSGCCSSGFPGNGVVRERTSSFSCFLSP